MFFEPAKQSSTNTPRRTLPDEQCVAFPIERATQKSKLVLGLFRANIIAAVLFVLAARDFLCFKFVGGVCDSLEEGDAPTATRTRTEAFRHLAGPSRFGALGEVQQLAKRNVVAVANLVVEVHQTHCATAREEIQPARSIWFMD